MSTFLSNPTAAALPQDELAKMSRGQLVQCSNVLHAGWIAANQKVQQKINDGDLTMQNQKAIIEQLSEERNELAADLHTMSTKLAHESQRKLDLEREVVRLRQSHKEKDVDPRIAELQGLLKQREADVIQLERTIRSMTPIDVRTKIKQLEILEKQREQDKFQMQQDAVRIAELAEKLRLIKEDMSLSSHSASTAETSPRYNRRPSSMDRRQSQQEMQSRSMVEQQEKRKEADAQNAKSVISRDAGCQTETFLVKALDLLNQRAAELEKMHKKLEIANDEVTSLRNNSQSLREELKVCREAEDRKEELIAQLTNKLENYSRTSSVSSSAADSSSAVSRNRADEQQVIESQSKVTAMKDRLNRVEKELHSYEAEMKNSNNKISLLKKENLQLKNSLLGLAEENAKVSAQFQAVSDYSPKKLSEMLHSVEELRELREKLESNKEKIAVADRAKEENESLSREIGTLTGRVSRYQAEMAMLTSKTEQQKATIEDLTVALQETRTDLEEVLHRPPLVMKLPPNPNNGWDNLTELETIFLESQLAKQAELVEEYKASLTEAYADAFRVHMDKEQLQRSFGSLLEDEKGILLGELQESKTAQQSFQREIESLRLQISAQNLQLEELRQINASLASAAETTTRADTSPRSRSPAKAAKRKAKDEIPQLGMEVGMSEGDVIVVDVEQHGPAHYTGVTVGNVVLQMEGVDIKSVADYHEVLETCEASTAFRITIRKSLDSKEVEDLVILL